MIRFGSAFAAAALVLTSAAFAQTQNVPTGQGVCAAGYDKSSQDGIVTGISTENLKVVDTNGDGKVSKAEFDNACTKKLFKDQEAK